MANLITGGRLLATNTTASLEARKTSGWMATKSNLEVPDDPDPAEDLALWRYHMIAEALSPKVGSKERGVIVPRIAGQEHPAPDGQPRRVSRNSIDRWIRLYRQHGLAGLRDRPAPTRAAANASRS